MTGGALHPWPWKTALVLFVLSLFLLGRQLDFHGFAHPDEPNKVRQITEGSYNFNHPLLMLHSVKVYAQLAGISDDYDKIIFAGRASSVVFSALAVGLLALVSGRLHGTFVAAAAGIFVLATPLFFELAHYFKEDPSLLFGLALTVLAIQVYSEKPTAGAAAFLGGAAGVAVSGKYAGLMVLPFAVHAVLTAGHKRDMIPFVLSALGIFALINFPMLTAPEVWKSRIDTEVARLQAEDVPNRRPIPHGVYFPLFGKHASPFLLGLLAVYLLWIWKRKFRLSPAEWTLLLLPALNIALLSFIPTKSDRYILPTNVLAATVAAAGLVPLLRWKHGRWLAGMVVATVIVWQAPRVQAEDAAFGSRRHEEVLEFVQARLPSSSVVLVDNFQSFPPPSRKNPELRQRVLRPGETLETLREEGVTHVLVTDRRYPVFAADSRKASGLSAEEEEQMRALYADIFDRCILIIGWEAGRKKQLEPEFRLYGLPK